MTPDDRNAGNRNDLTAASTALTRRQFLKRMGLLGGGIIVYFNVGGAALWARSHRHPNIPQDFNAFLRIAADGKVTLYTGKIEMGQGPMTSLPQMLAEELDVSYDAVTIVMGDTDLCPWDMGTFGSQTTRLFGPLLREAAAEAKGVLKTLAAQVLNCPIERLQTADGAVFDRATPSRRVSYGRLTKGNVIEKHLADAPLLKPASDFTIIGRSYPRRDAHDKVTGRALYAGDIRLPGLRYARLLRPPAHGAQLKRIDTRLAEKIKGVEIIKDGDLIAVLHETPDGADQALGMIQAHFDLPTPGLNDRNIFEHLLANAPEPEPASQDGDLSVGRKMADHIVTETYLNNYVAHAPLEPHTATARFDGRRMTIWSSTQAPFADQRRVAEALNLAPGDVQIITPFVGGGFGGKTWNPQVLEAARLTRLSGYPVQVAWSREEEFFFDTFRPAAIVKIESGLTAAGKIVFWDYKVYFAGRRGAEQFYAIPHHRELYLGQWRGGGRGVHPFGVGPWRAPANNTNTYARELHLNIMAAEIGVDPLTFRLRNLTDRRMIGVLKAAAEAFGWDAQKPSGGRGFGIACGIDAGTYVANLVEASVDRHKGGVKVERVVCAQDMGVVVNPEGAKMQMEGCITMGLGYALSEEIHFENGKILDRNFDTYAIPRFSWLPRIETILVKNEGLAPQGGGEPAIIGMGGAIATAVHSATGARPLQLPMTPARVIAAIEKRQGRSRHASI